MWKAASHEIPSGLRIEVLGNDERLTFREIFGHLEDDALFADWYGDQLARVPLDAYYWEHPPLTESDLDEPAEFVLIDAPSLAGSKPDPQSFEDHFSRSRGAEVVAFQNLGGDALLIVPSPVASRDAYPHLAAFVRGAPRSQRRSLLHATGRAMRERVGSAPRWLSTAGLGVPWLHVRIDTRPKYYHHSPYKEIVVPSDG